MTVEELNQKYTQTCAELGDLVYKTLDLRDQRDQIEALIDESEKKVTAYRKVREDLQKALQEVEKAEDPYLRSEAKLDAYMEASQAAQGDEYDE